MKDNIIKAPFTPEQTEALNAYQKLGYVHEYMCSNNHSGSKLLVAYQDGWHCPNCSYTQNWAHEYSLDTAVFKEVWENSPFKH